MSNIFSIGSQTQLVLCSDCSLVQYRFFTEGEKEKTLDLFIEEIHKYLEIHTIYRFEQNYIVNILTKNAYHLIVPDQAVYFSVTSLSQLLNLNQLELADIKMLNDKITFYIKSMSNIKKVRLLEKKMQLQNTWTYFLFSMRVNQLIKKSNS